MQSTPTCINASHWLTDTYLHYDIYSPNSHGLIFLKKQLEQQNNLSINHINFKDYYQPFAFIIHDTLTKEFFLVRDHFGLEPFYYTVISDESQKLCFGSNLPDVLAHINNPMKDTEQITQVLMDICISSLQYTDKTYYHNLFRVTPGHIFQIALNPQRIIKRQTFWTLKPGTPKIHYTSDADYDAHFAALLHEAIQESCCSSQGIALEFSGGLDSGTLCTALSAQGIAAHLFMHVGETDEERRYGESLLRELQTKHILHDVNADDFDIIAVLDQCKKWFAGGAPYLFFMFAQNIHQAVKKEKCSVLLSGFGGDECVSSHAPLRTLGAEVQYKFLWNELKTLHPKATNIRRSLQAVKLKHPYLHYTIQKIKSYQTTLKRLQAPTHFKPYHSLQEREADWLTGDLSQHVRMRVEYSAVVAQKMGFNYRYPLLYPPLIDFCFALPYNQKRRQGQNRLLMRRYLARHLSSGLFNSHKKCGDILPGTLPKCVNLYNQGGLNFILKDLPYANKSNYIKKNKLITADRHLHLDLLRYMWKTETV